jgi:hypothetical protein
MFVGIAGCWTGGGVGWPLKLCRMDAKSGLGTAGAGA